MKRVAAHAMLVCLFCFTLTLGSGNPSVVASAQQAALPIRLPA